MSRNTWTVWTSTWPWYIQVSDIFDYNADSPPYYHNHSPNHNYKDLGPIPLPVSQLPTPTMPPLIPLTFRSPLHLLANTAVAHDSVSSIITSYSELPTILSNTSHMKELTLPTRPPSPIDYNRVAFGVTPVDTDGNSPPRYMFPSTAPSPIPIPPVPQSLPRPLPPLPEDAQLANQENTIPLPDFSNPPCVGERHIHPHQYIAINTPWREEWQPYHKVKLEKPIDFPLVEDLINNPLQFPTVTPFCSKSAHVQRVYPRNQPLAHILQIPTVAICSKAVVTPPCTDFPLGYIKYNFGTSLVNTFSNYVTSIQGAFTNSLVVFEIVDLLDGRQITTYRYPSEKKLKLYMVHLWTYLI